MANGITAARRVLDLQPPHFAGINTKQRMVAYTRQVDVASLYHEGSVLIADTDNHRVMLFAPGIFDGVVVAGGNCIKVSFFRSMSLKSTGSFSRSLLRIARWIPNGCCISDPSSSSKKR